MTSPHLSVPEINLLLALVPMRGPATTKDFEEKFSFDKVDKTARESLSDQGYITCDDRKAPYIYELTDSGWVAARNIIASPRPSRVSPLSARIVWVMLNDIEAFMKLKNIELSDIYAEPALTIATPGPEDSDSPMESIAKAYRDLARAPGAWLPLHDLRQHLNQFHRSDVDEALINLFDKGEIQLRPEENQKALRPEDREAALRLGGGDKHFILIEVP